MVRRNEAGSPPPAKVHLHGSGAARRLTQAARVRRSFSKTKKAPTCAVDMVVKPIAIACSLPSA